MIKATPEPGFEPGSKAPQAFRIIRYPTRAVMLLELAGTILNFIILKINKIYDFVNNFFLSAAVYPVTFSIKSLYLEIVS